MNPTTADVLKQVGGGCTSFHAEHAFARDGLYRWRCAHCGLEVTDRQVVEAGVRADTWFERYYALWCRYIVDTEDFDRTLRHAMVEGEARVFPEDISASRAYSLRRRRELLLERLPHREADALEVARKAASKTSVREARRHAATDEQIAKWKAPQDP